MKPIKKEELKGKYVQYQDKDGKYRVDKVIKIIGRTLTLKNCLDQKTRVNLDYVNGMVWHKNKLRPIE